MSFFIERSLLGVLVGIAFLLGASISWLVFGGMGAEVTGNVVQELASSGGTYSWTTAVCNAHRQCIDMLIECVDGAVVRMTPVSNLTQFSETWVDPRTETRVFCQ